MKDKILDSLLKRIELAIVNGFYIEAISIIHSILENKTYELLDSLGIPYKSADRTYQCLTYFVMHMTARDVVVLEDLETNEQLLDWLTGQLIRSGLVERIHEWRNERNVIIHDLGKTGLNEYQLDNLARNGQIIIGEYLTILGEMHAKILD